MIRSHRKRFSQGRILSLAFALTLALCPSLYADWPREGKRLTPLNNVHEWYNTAPDSVGGAYIGWEAGTPPGQQIYARVQRVDHDGNLLWDEQGIAPADPDSMYKQTFNEVLPAPGGCAYVSSSCYLEEWMMRDLYVQKLSPDGERLWGSRGVNVTPGNQSAAVSWDLRWLIVPDGEGGLIHGYRLGTSIGASRISADGELLWYEQEVAPPEIHGISQMFAVTDSMGGAIFTWRMDGAIYASGIDGEGNPYWYDYPPVLTSSESEVSQLTVCNFGLRSIMVQGFASADEYGSNYGYFMNYINQEGEPQWGHEGIFIIGGNYTSSFSFPYNIVSLGGYVYTCISYYPNGNHIFKFNMNGDALFGENGLLFDDSLDSDVYETCLTIDSSRVFLAITGVTERLGRILYCLPVNFDGTFPCGSQLLPVAVPAGLSYGLLYPNKISDNTTLLTWYIGNNNALYGMPVNADGTTPAFPNEVNSSLSQIPSNLKIRSVFPVPFNQTLKLVCSIPNRGNYKVTVHDIQGRMLNQQVYYDWSASDHQIDVNGREWTSGAYFIKLENMTNRSHTTRKIVLLK